MKKSRFTETQIVGILKEAESGMAMADLLRHHGISGATFYKWRSKYGGLDASELKCVKELEQQLSDGVAPIKRWLLSLVTITERSRT